MRAWLEAMLALGVEVKVPGIIDYELRRELVRSNFTESIRALDELIEVLGYLAVSKAITDRACILWAEVRNVHEPGCTDESLDADMILCAHGLEECAGDCMIATSNVAHIDKFVSAMNWEEIKMEHLTA